MAGWTPKKRKAVEAAFYAFLDRCYVNSKDAGRICLGQELYDGQIKFVTAVFDSLEQDIHKIYVLKSRQLGLSTIARALSMFLLGIHPGLKGAIVFDTDQNRTESRAELEMMINDLPAALKFPAIVPPTNRSGLTLANNSKVLFMSAGVRKSKTSGTLGRSAGLSLAHLSELCSYDNDAGLIAFEESLSDMNPDRLYIYESTARGRNAWYRIWRRARKDPAHCTCVFLGWWSKPSQKISRMDKDFQLYGLDPPSEEEVRKIAQVRELYQHEVTQEQLAWIRRKMDPTASQIAEDTDAEEDDPARVQEQPWAEEEAFQISGAKFFSNKTLQDQTTKNVSAKYKGWVYFAGNEFVDMKVLRAESNRHVDLKVWEEPASEACYIVACDPAYGENENNDRSAVQVLRCFSDGLDQVAEYASPLINTRQLAWVVASLLGYYSQGKSEARYILELNGPGIAVYNELKALKFQIDNSYLGQEYQERGLQDIFRNVRAYIYTRPDSLGSGQNSHFKTNTHLKVTIMEQLRAYVMSGLMRVRSMSTIEEMQMVSREGDSISSGSSEKDDCVLGLALGAYYWDTGVRKTLISLKKSREAEQFRLRNSIKDQVLLFSQNQLKDFFEQKARTRTAEKRAAARMGWRGR